MNKLVFKEIQKMTQWWLWFIIIVLLVIPIFGIYQQVIQGKSFGNNPMSNTGMIIMAIFMLCFVVALYSMKLKTSIDTTEINISFFPFVKRQFLWKEIKSAQVIQYGFVGGWGIRIWTKYGTVYNMSGNKGLAIEMKNGDKFLIGTQKDLELRAFIKELSINQSENQNERHR